MKRTILTLAFATQLAAGGAFAQTSDTTAETTDSGTASATFGSDWSETLLSAMFGEDGTTVRSESELVSEWDSLSEDDKEMLRRDCMLYMQHSGGVSGSAGTQSGEGDDSTGDTDTATDSAGETSDSAGAATGSTGTATGSSGTQSGSDTTSDTSTAESSGTVSVSSEQMEQICAATEDL